MNKDKIKRQTIVNSTLIHIQEYGITIKDLFPDVSQAECDSIPSLPEDVYQLKGKPGCVLIMSNSFAGKRGERVKANKKDVENMKDLWQEKIGCELFNIKNSPIIAESQQKAEGDGQNRMEIRQRIDTKRKEDVYENVTAEEMKELLTSLSETTKNYAYIVVVISSHGEMLSESAIKEAEVGEASCDSIDDRVKEAMKQVFYGEDWKPVREKGMIELFYNDKNPKLKEIPKLFILNYCRSERGKTGPKKQALSGPDGDPTIVDESCWLDGLAAESIPPLVSDMATVFATHHYFRAFQNSSGSWLITAVAEVFGEWFKKKGVLEMLTKVNKRVKDLCDKEDATSVFESSLVKEFRLWIMPREGTSTPPTDDAKAEENEESFQAAENLEV